MRKTAIVSLSALLLSACTSTLRPVQVALPEVSGQDDPCGDFDAGTPGEDAETEERLRWYACALNARAHRNLAQSLEWQNRTEWRDIPLLGAAATVAGLLLFGRRDAQNNLTPGEQEAIQITAFAAAGFSALINYLSPATARRLLRQGARGHYCMAGQGEVILSIWSDVQNKETTADSLSLTVQELNVELATAPSTTPGLAQYIAARDTAVRALALYELQRQQLEGAHIFLGESAWNFGIRLIEAADRSPVEVTQLVESISAQANSIARFNAAQGGTGGDPGANAPPPPPPINPNLTPAERAAELARRDAAERQRLAALNLEQLARLAASQSSSLLTGLPNVEALVLGFERCASTALVGGQPTVTRIQRVSLSNTQP